MGRVRAKYVGERKRGVASDWRSQGERENVSEAVETMTMEGEVNGDWLDASYLQNRGDGFLFES